MDKKAQKPFMYLRNGDILYESEGRKAMAKNEAEDIIKTIRGINPDLEDTRQNDISMNKKEDRENNGNKEIDLLDKITDAFKDGPLKWKPSLEKKHESSSTFTSSFSEKASTEDSKMKETNKLCGEAAASGNADAGGHINFSLGEIIETKAEYNAKVNGTAEISYLGFSDKRSKTEENERELKIAHCSAKGEVGGELKGSANFKAMGHEGKADINVKLDAGGQASFTGLEYKSKNTEDGTEGSVKILHAKAKGKANFKASGAVGKHKVDIEANAKGKAKFKAVDGKFVLAAKKRSDGGIYIPGVQAILGEAKAKGEAEFHVDTEINGKKVDKKGKISGEAKLSGFKIKALSVDIRREKVYRNVNKAKAAMKGAEGNFLNVEAIGKKKGDKKVVSASVTGAKVNAGNVNATAIDDRTIHKGNIESGLSADIGNVNANLLGHKGTTNKVNANLGVEMFNISIGIDRSTGVSASTKFSFFNINLTIGPPKLDFSMNSFGLNFGIPFFSGSGGDGGGGTGDCKINSKENKENEKGSNIVNKREGDSNNGGGNVSSQNLDGNIGESSTNAQNSASCYEENIESFKVHRDGSSMMANINCSRYEQGDSSHASTVNSEGYTNNRTMNRNVYGDGVYMENESIALEGHSSLNNTDSVYLKRTESGSTPIDNTPSYPSDAFHDKSHSKYRGARGNSMYKNSNVSKNEEMHQYLATDEAEINGNISRKDLQGHVYEQCTFDSYGNVVPAGDDDLMIVIDQAEDTDMFCIANALHAEEVVPDQPFTKRMSGIIDSVKRQMCDNNEESVTKSKFPTEHGCDGEIQNVNERRLGTMFHKDRLRQSTGEHMTGGSPFSNECSDYTGRDSHASIRTTRPITASQKNIRRSIVDRANENQNTLPTGKISAASATINDGGKADEKRLIDIKIAYDQRKQNISKAQSRMKESSKNSEQLKTKMRLKGSDKQNARNVDASYKKILESKAYLSKNQMLLHGNGGKRTRSNLNPVAYENPPDRVIDEDQLQISGTSSTVFERSKSEETAQPSDNLTDKENYNKYIASLVNNRLDESNGNVRKSTQSGKSGNKESALPFLNVKDALVEKYTDGKKSGNSTSKTKKSKDGTDSKNCASSANTEDNREQSQLSETAATKSKLKKKEEPQKPFGVNKNIHSIFTLAGAESKPVKYLKDNVACFCDE